ncbi:MAG: hypothetical protein CMN78_04690 [Spirochaetales bacterium]|nr:hypothetical protein [Spirochaetales bacterium]
MAWQIARNGDFEELITFLNIVEWGHVAFSSRLLVKGKKNFPSGSQAKIYINVVDNRQPKIAEAILVSSTGLVVPVLARSGDEGKEREDIVGIFANSKLGPAMPKVHSIMGIKRNVLELERCLHRQAYAALNYHLMTLDKLPANGADGALTYECRKGRLKDTSLLYPLQKAYEIEEVLINPSNFNSRLCYLHLQKALKNEMVYFIVEKGSAVAKAGSNAQGFSYIQIGGVYTVETKRNEGYGAEVLKFLISKIIKKGKKACLFVKKDNSPAIQLYTKVGFSIRDAFRISYFH